MTAAIYAGSFDPWSTGHDAVLKASLEVFSEIHVLVAINPSKQGSLDPLTRARIIASAIEPCINWWNLETPFHVGENVVVTTTPGLVVEYAGTHGIHHLVRGLRSTTDFESEFNLYFSNKTIDSRIQTWAVLCPPELLHCSSTYVRSVVGNPAAKKVGTTFAAQCAMLNQPISFGRVFDFIVHSSKYRFENENADLDIGHLKMTLQGLFTTLLRSQEKIGNWRKNESALDLDALMSMHNDDLKKAFELHEYPREVTASTWLLLAKGISNKCNELKDNIQSLHLLATLGGSLGRARIPLFDVRFAEEISRRS
jgi:pantetheine-phosphate adenylyltransferase